MCSPVSSQSPSRFEVDPDVDVGVSRTGDDFHGVFGAQRTSDPEEVAEGGAVFVVGDAEQVVAVRIGGWYAIRIVVDVGSKVRAISVDYVAGTVVLVESRIVDGRIGIDAVATGIAVVDFVDGVEVVFDFAAVGESQRSRSHVTRRCEVGIGVIVDRPGNTEACDGVAGLCPGWDVDIERVDLVGNRFVDEYMFPCVGNPRAEEVVVPPIAVAVEIDPGVEQSRSRDGDRNTRGFTWNDAAVEDDAGFVVSAVDPGIHIVAGGIDGWDPVGVVVNGIDFDGGPEERSSDDVSWAVQGPAGSVAIGCIAVIHSGDFPRIVFHFTIRSESDRRQAARRY